MRFENAYIPYGAYWSSPFCRWQGSFANLHPIRFAAEISTRAMAEREINPKSFHEVILGMTIPAPNSFYGASWLAGLIGAEEVTGPTGMRLVIELIEELVLCGGGYGLFTGCAAGDTAGAILIQVEEV